MTTSCVPTTLCNFAVSFFPFPCAIILNLIQDPSKNSLWIPDQMTRFRHDSLFQKSFMKAGDLKALENETQIFERKEALSAISQCKLIKYERASQQKRSEDLA